MCIRVCIFQDCRQKFQGGSFFDHEGLPYCETHYHAKRGSLCAGCHKPITGEYGEISHETQDLLMCSFFFLFRSVHNSDVPEIPSRALCVRVLSEAIEQRHIQGTKWQAILPRLLWKALRINNLWSSKYIFCNIITKWEIVSLSLSLSLSFSDILLLDVLRHILALVVYIKARNEAHMPEIALENFHFFINIDLQIV